MRDTRTGFEGGIQNLFLQLRCQRPAQPVPQLCDYADMHFREWSISGPACATALLLVWPAAYVAAVPSGMPEIVQVVVPL